MAEQSDVGDADTAASPEQLHELVETFTELLGLTDDVKGRLEEMLVSIPWADPELAARRWLRSEAAGLHDEAALDQYREAHPEEYPELEWHRRERFLWEMQRKGIVSRPPATRPVARSRERRSPRRSVRRASCRARSPGRKPEDPDPHHVSAGGAR